MPTSCLCCGKNKVRYQKALCEDCSSSKDLKFLLTQRVNKLINDLNILTGRIELEWGSLKFLQKDKYSEQIKYPMYLDIQNLRDCARKIHEITLEIKAIENIRWFLSLSKIDKELD